MAERPHITVKAPPGRPCWVSHGDLPLVYLGWGRRDFHRQALPRHYDVGTNFYLVLKGDLRLSADGREHRVAAPCACIIDRECLFGVTGGRSKTVEILVWVWRDAPQLDGLRPGEGGVRRLPLRAEALPRLLELHRHCREEVARTDGAIREVLSALRTLVEVELGRAGEEPDSDEDRRWVAVREWIGANLAMQAPVPALCDYLRMSASTLNRFFRKRTGVSPGAYFRAAKLAEASRLIQNEGWPVKTTAYHLGYRHATDLSRALARQAGLAVGRR